MRKPVFLLMLVSAAVSAQPAEIVERDGVARRATLLEQGVPVPPMSDAEARSLTLRGVPSFIEPEAHDHEGNVSWVRVSALVRMPARGRLAVRIEKGAAAVPRLKLTRAEGAIAVETPAYRLTLKHPGVIELEAGGRKLLAGNWSVELVGDARAILWGLYLREFVPTGIEVEDQSDHRATLLLKGYYSKNYRKQPKIEEKGRRFDCELRLHVNALSPNIRFGWRITNLTGSKTWLERYALKLPLPAAATLAPGSRADRAFVDLGAGARLALTANFIDDLGRGAGMELASDSRALLHGGLAMPPDGGYYSGRVPDIHRMFHEGMSRTFEGALITTGGAQAAAEELAPVDLVLPAQYYSDLKILPEAGDTVTFGEFETAVRRSAEWLLQSQWRGTLWWGEWYREWDEDRGMGVQDTANGNISSAPLYHYMRTGDARFLRCARRAFQFTWDVQISKLEENPGPMYHTRRNLFDELGWIHPRYQRAKGGLVTSHVVLNAAARREIIRTIRSFHEHMFDENGVPHDWDRRARRRLPGENGADTSNFIEALVYCYRETGDRYFLDSALKMARWTERRWQHRNDSPADHWDWNLAQYALRGLVSLYEITRDQRVRDLSIDIARKVLANKSPRIEDMKDGIGGRKIDNVFFHAWITAQVTRFAPDGRDLLDQLYEIVRLDAAGQRSDGLFVLDHGIESGRRTRWTSVYDAKSLVAYVPALAARVAALRGSRDLQPSLTSPKNKTNGH